MIRESELTELLTFDLETSGEVATLKDLERINPRKAELWRTKCQKASVKDPDKWSDAEAAFVAETPLSPEFGRIVCASFCHIVTDGKVFMGKIKSFYDNKATEESERELVLKPVADLLNNIKKTGKPYKLCGHNIKKFDIPFLAKRIIISGLELPDMLATRGKKPWELDSVDTGEIWAMGAWDQYVSLDLLTGSLGIQSPKESMKGEYVGKAFWQDMEYDKIARYCEEDIKAVARICHKWSNSHLPLIF